MKPQSADAVSDAASFFNRFAEAFDTLYDGRRNRFMRWVDRRFRSDMFARFAMTFDSLGNLEGKTVVDIGCGSGPYVIEALRRGAREVTAVDPAPNMLALARERAVGAGVMDRCKLVEGIFPGAAIGAHDLGIVMGVMDYVPDPLTFLTALRPIVRETAAVSFPSKHWFRTPLRKVRYRLRRCPVYFYDEALIRRLASSAGFTRTNVRKIPGAGMDYHVCLSP